MNVKREKKDHYKDIQYEALLKSTFDLEERFHIKMFFIFIF